MPRPILHQVRAPGLPKRRREWPKGVTPAAPAPASDWTARTSAPGVVWHHSFDNAAEVNNFRWTGGYGSGNDPLEKGGALLSGNPSTVRHVASGGADGGGFMRLTRPAGASKDDIYWYRQFSPLTGASNGRGVDDPAASNTITLRTFTPTDGGQQTAFWATQNPAGWYGKPGYDAAISGQVAAPFDGHEFYLQLRVRARPDRMTTGNVINGKFTNFTITTQSHPNQELVTVSAYPTPTSPVGGPYQDNIHQMYEGAFTGNIGDGSNATFGIRNTISPQWAYSGGWDTLLYHIVPGTNDVNRASDPQVQPFTYDTLIEVWAAHEGETTYTKIWQANFSAIFDGPTASAPYTHNKWAWNAFICWIYQNGLSNATEIVQDYDQIIFSKDFIPCPGAAGSLSVESFNSNEGTDPIVYTDTAVFWTSMSATDDGKLIGMGAGTHQALPNMGNGDNGVREWDPLVGGASVYAYPPTGLSDNQYGGTQYDNHPWFYSATRDWILFPSSGVYDRSVSEWIAGNQPRYDGQAYTKVVRGTGSTALIYEDLIADTGWHSIFNAHQAWSDTLDCGFMCGGGYGAGFDGTWNAPYLYLIVPSVSGINATAASQGNPYTIYRKSVADVNAVLGVTVNKIRARDSACFLGDYVYWCGGQTDDANSGATYPNTPHFFRMNVRPHLTSKDASLTSGFGAIERLADCPISETFGLLMADPYLNALLYVTASGIYAYDVTYRTWSDVTPVVYTSALFNNRSRPYGCMGDFIASRNGQTIRKFYWRPGYNNDGVQAWNEGDPANWQTIMSLKLKRN